MTKNLYNVSDRGGEDRKKLFPSSFLPHWLTNTHTHTHSIINLCDWREPCLQDKTATQEKKWMFRIKYIILEGHVQYPNKGTRYPERGWQKQGQRPWKAIVSKKWTKEMLVPQSSSSWSCNIWQGVCFTGFTLLLRIFSPDFSFLENRKILFWFPNRSLLTPISCSDKLPTTLWNMTHKAQCHYKLRAMADLWIQLPPCL